MGDFMNNVANPCA